MTTIQSSIDVAVPVRAAYNQWTQFEDFPRFMDGVESVTQLDDKTLHWVATIAGAQREWTAEIIEQVPDQRIVWRSTDGERHTGMVLFETTADAGCRVTLVMEYDPEDFLEKAADTLGVIRRRIEGDLERFKAFIEERENPTGAWRGEIRSNDTRRAG